MLIVMLAKSSFSIRDLIVEVVLGPTTASNDIIISGCMGLSVTQGCFL